MHIWPTININTWISHRYSSIMEWKETCWKRCRLFCTWGARISSINKVVQCEYVHTYPTPQVSMQDGRWKMIWTHTIRLVTMLRGKIQWCWVLSGKRLIMFSQLKWATSLQSDPNLFHWVSFQPIKVDQHLWNHPSIAVIVGADKCTLTLENVKLSKMKTRGLYPY